MTIINSLYYEQQIKRELKGIHTCECRWNERLKSKTDGSTGLPCIMSVYYNGDIVVYYEWIKRELKIRPI